MNFSRYASLYALQSVLCAAALLVGFTAQTSFANTVIPEAIRKDFASACLGAYLHSSPSAQAMGQQLCVCASKEASSQGVRPDKLKQETARIRQNPKYNIQDKALLNSVQACFIDIYSQEVRKTLKADDASAKAKTQAVDKSIAQAAAAHKRTRKARPSPNPSPRPVARPNS
jgi:hypothetical protein